MSPQEELLTQYNEEKSIIAEMLFDYVERHGCPCSWKQYESVVSKEFSSGFHDEYQNILAEATLKLACFEHTEIQAGFDVLLTCKCCKRKWRYLCEEWRMMAYRRRVVPEVQVVEVNEGLIGLPFSTAGFEPDFSKIASIEEWYLYMTQRELSYPSRHGIELVHPKSFIQKLISLFRK